MAADLIVLDVISSYRDRFAVFVCSRAAAFAQNLASRINVTLGRAAAPSAAAEPRVWCVFKDLMAGI